MMEPVSLPDRSVLYALFWCITGAVIVLAAGVVVADQTSTDAAAWIEAIATVAAFGAATAAALYAAGAYRREVIRDKARDHDARQAQASLVAAWPAPFDVAYQYDSREGVDTGMVVGVSVYVRNASSVPVTNVLIDFVLARTLPSGVDSWSTHVGQKRVAVVPPGESAETYALGERARVPLGDDSEARLELRTAIVFTDAGNRRWQRTVSGQLVILTD
jgi:hypothetical protein